MEARTGAFAPTRGPRGLWSEAEAAAARWASQGRPGVDRRGLTVIREANTVWLDEPGNRVGDLPPT